MFQAVLEACLFETLECLWINCLVPLLVYEKIGRAKKDMHRIVIDLCSKQLVDDNDRNFLNAADYLFVSAHVAKQFSVLLEVCEPTHLQPLVLEMNE